MTGEHTPGAESAHNVVEHGDGNLVQARDVGNAHLGSGHVFTGTVIYQEASRELTERFSERLAAAEQVVRELVAREQELRTELAVQSARGDDLERQLRDVQAHIAARPSDEAPRRQLALLSRHRDEEVGRTAELRAELSAIVVRRQDAEHAVELVRAEQTELDEFFATIEDLLHLNFVRAEEERREKERLHTECEGLRRRVQVLETTLALYQADPRMP